LQGNVLNQAVLVFNRADNKQFDGQIDGNGSIVKMGAGSLNLTGSGGITGRTEVRSGKLGFNGLFYATDVQVNNGAWVYGVGTVRSLNLAPGGVIAPGNSIGTFNVLNNIVFNKGSVYAVEVNTAGLSDMIKVGGIADIKGGHVLVNAESGEYSPKSQYTVLSAGGGVSGQFDSIYANFAFLDPNLSYDISNVSLALVRNDVKPIDLCQSVNEKAICAELLPVVPEPEVAVTPIVPVVPVVEPAVAVTPVSLDSGVKVVVGEKNDLYEKEQAAVIGMSQSEFTRFATLLPGDIHPTVKTVLAQESSYVRDSISKRLYETDKGLSGSGAWGHAFGSEGRQGGAGSIPALSRNTQGFILGSDVWLEDADLSLGVFGGYRKTSMSQGVSSADIGTYNLGVYGAKRYEALSVRLGASFSWHDIETRRKIYYKANTSTPDANYHGSTAQLFSELAYDLRFDRFNVEPFVGLSYTRLEVSGFSEEKDLFSLSGKREVKNIYAGTLGARVNHSTQYNEGLKVSFQAGAGLKHAFSDISSNTNMALNSHGNDFRISGLPLKKNIAQLNAQVAVQTKGGFTVGLDYMAGGASGMRDQSLSAFGSWEF
ncbi:TPA: autotransporter domain-containing protein, partial [Pseudomonas aeruginosa]|nr:autotransporter domain-containing protein [Pseudomonas aeruginosa]